MARIVVHGWFAPHGAPPLPHPLSNVCQSLARVVVHGWFAPHGVHTRPPMFQRLPNWTGATIAVLGAFARSNPLQRHAEPFAEGALTLEDAEAELSAALDAFGAATARLAALPLAGVLVVRVRVLPGGAIDSTEVLVDTCVFPAQEDGSVDVHRLALHVRALHLPPAFPCPLSLSLALHVRALHLPPAFPRTLS